MHCGFLMISLALISADPTGGNEFITTPWTAVSGEGDLAMIFKPGDVWHTGTAWIIGHSSQGFRFGKVYVAWKANYQVFTTEDPDIVLLRLNFTKHYIGIVTRGGIEWRQEQSWSPKGVKCEIAISNGKYPQEKMTLLGRRPYRFDSRGDPTEFIKNEATDFLDAGDTIRFTRKPVGEFPSLRNMADYLPPGLEVDEGLFKVPNK